FAVEEQGAVLFVFRVHDESTKSWEMLPTPQTKIRIGLGRAIDSLPLNVFVTRELLPASPQLRTPSATSPTVITSNELRPIPPGKGAPSSGRTYGYGLFEWGQSIQEVRRVLSDYSDIKTKVIDAYTLEIQNDTGDRAHL